ncbi:MAG: hypothetical protein HN559_05460 [Gemmatimonadetes bacterium]|nr:hypothetical protein [Gemmatimonadota bacterium]
MTSSETFARPFPALTPSQRYHLDVFGYVVVENTLSSEQVGCLHEAMQRLKTDLLAAGEGGVVRGCRLSARHAHHCHFAHILEADPAIYEYLTNPRLVGFAEELVGGSVRLEESEAVINHRPDPAPDAGAPFGFHTGTAVDQGTYTENGLFHCTFVKTLTNLTDLEPDDGGTVCIAGSHKIKAPREQIIACAEEDRSLIHQVTAPAGSTLLFGESLIHATGPIRSDRERVIVIGGYTPTMFQAWNGQEPSAEFVAAAEPRHQALLSGSDRWSWQRQHRSLAMPVHKPSE